MKARNIFCGIFALRVPPKISISSALIEKPASVLWVTNLAAPYRIPVWQHLAGKYKVTVALLESNETLQRDPDSNRWRDWLHGSVDGITFTELPSWKYRRGESRYYILKRLSSLLAIRNNNLILFGGWESPAYWSFLLCAVVLRTARVGFYESPVTTMTYRSGVVARIRSRFFRSMHVVVVPGVAAAESVLRMGVQPARIMQGFNAVDVSKFHKAGTSAAQPVSMGHRYLYVGQLIHRKRVEAILEAFVKIAEPTDELTILGAGDLREQLRASAQRSGTKINILDPIANSDMPTILSSHHTLVLASEREVWGLVVNEALASGMHVVVAENCGVVPSIRGMRGFYPADPGLRDLAAQMQASKEHWAGRIPLPEILEYTPERFASVFEAAFTASLAPNSNVWTRNKKG